MDDSTKPMVDPPAFLNGEILAAGDARLPIADRGLLFGFGFFESFRTSGGRPHLWPLHQRRLKQACATAGLPIPAGWLVENAPRLTDVLEKLLQERGLRDAAFRYTVTAGLTDHSPNEFLTMRPLPPLPPVEGVGLRVLNVRRDTGEWIPRPKSLNYLNAFIGARELSTRTDNVSDEGLFLSRDGDFVVETTRQNVAWIVDGQICFPDLSLGALAGTGLTWMLDLQRAVRPVRAQLAELLSADAVFLLNSVRGITPVDQIRDQNEQTIREAIGSHRHPVVVSLRRQWQEALDATAR